MPITICIVVFSYSIVLIKLGFHWADFAPDLANHSNRLYVHNSSAGNFASRWNRRHLSTAQIAPDKIDQQPIR